jgi:glutathione S-transferase
MLELGQANHFTRYAPETIEYGVNRYQNETRRLYRVIDNHLADGDKEYLVGNKCTIADIAHFGWLKSAAWAGIDISEFPKVDAWVKRMEARPAFEKGRKVPRPSTVPTDPKEFEAHAAKTRAWVQAGMKEEAKK